MRRDRRPVRINLNLRWAKYYLLDLCEHLLKVILPTRSSIKRMSPKRRASSPLKQKSIKAKDHQYLNQNFLSLSKNNNQEEFLTWIWGLQRRQWGETLCEDPSTSRWDRAALAPGPGSKCWCLLKMSHSAKYGHHNVGEGSRGVEEEVELGESDGRQPDGDVASKPWVKVVV